MLVEKIFMSFHTSEIDRALISVSDWRSCDGINIKFLVFIPVTAVALRPGCHFRIKAILIFFVIYLFLSNWKFRIQIYVLI